MSWSLDMDATLKVAWTAGLTSPQIAVLVGSVSPSAVRYRARYLNLKPRGEAESAFGGRHKAAPTPYSPRSALPTLEAGPHPFPVPWASRAWNQCAYPVGEDRDGPTCCGAPVPLGSRRRYCPHHLAQTVSHDERAA